MCLSLRDSSVVYFAIRRRDGAIKIGVTGCLGARVQALVSEFRSPYRILSTLPGGIDLEWRLQCQFAAFALGREHFRPAPEVLAFALAPSLGRVMHGPLPKRLRDGSAWVARLPELPQGHRLCGACAEIGHSRRNCPLLNAPRVTRSAA